MQGQEFVASSMIVHDFVKMLSTPLVSFRGHDGQDQRAKACPSGHVQTCGVTPHPLKAFHTLFAVR